MNLKEIAQKIGAQIHNPQGKSENVKISGLAPLLRAGPSELSFLSNAKFREQLRNTQAAAVIVHEVQEDCSSVQLIHPNPQEAMAIASLCFFSYKHSMHGKSDKAFVHEKAKLAKNVTLYPFAFVDSEASIGEGTVIYPHVYIGSKAKIGKDCTIFPGVKIMSEVEIGDRVILHPNVVLGGDGFGFASGKNGITKIPQIGKVVVGSDVEIGSLSNIDRATFDQTSIGHTTKIDSLVHIGHNVEIGEYSILCGQFGVAGSTKIGKRFLAAGQSGVNQGITIGDGVTIGGRCAVTGSLPDGGTYLGLPERPAKDWHKEVIAIKSLPDLLKRFRSLEATVELLIESSRSK